MGTYIIMGVDTMKKIGILSLYYKNYNYGGLLQAYALVTAVEKNQFKAEQICVQPDSKTHKRNALFFLKIPLRLMKKGFKLYVSGKLKERNSRFNSFMQEIHHSEKIYSVENIGEANKAYDGFICGSDQVWNPYYFTPKETDVYTLRFANENKSKASYAASVGVSNLTEDQKQVLNQALQSFSHISLREESARSLFSKEMSEKMNVVLDPTLLLTSDEWALKQSAVDVPEKYIFCYFLGPSKENRKMAKEISKKLGIPIVTNPYISPGSELADIGFGNIKIMNAGPKEFLYLINHAELVLTDSFHACVFSLQFKRPFLAFSRDDKGNKASMHSRLYDFAEKFHLQNQLMLGEKRPFDPACMKIDWAPAYEVLAKERENSMEFLRNALSEIND